MKMEKKQCARCKKDLEISLFNLHGRQLTKCCVKCLHDCKKLRQQTKCEHGRQRSGCKDCSGGHIVEHNKRRSTCKDCGRSQIYEHNRQRSKCLSCGGGGICEHNKERSTCKDCGGGQICEHNKKKPYFKDYGGGHICEHNKQRSACPVCDPLGHLVGFVRSRVYIAFKNDKDARGDTRVQMSSTEFLGCNIEAFKKHTEQQFTCHGKIMVNGISIIKYR